LVAQAESGEYDSFRHAGDVRPFVEAEHPRDGEGKWTEIPGSGIASAISDLSEGALESAKEINNAAVDSREGRINDREARNRIESAAESATGISVTIDDSPEEAARAAKELIRLDDAGFASGVDEFAYSSADPSTGREAGSYSRLDNKVVVNPEVVESGELQEWAEENKIGGSTVEWVARHEIGHAQHRDTMTVDESRNLRGASFDSEEEELIENGLSEYASTKPTEFIAEAFAHKVSGRGELPGFLEGTYRAFNGPEVTK